MTHRKGWQSTLHTNLQLVHLGSSTQVSTTLAPVELSAAQSDKRSDLVVHALIGTYWNPKGSKFFLHQPPGFSHLYSTDFHGFSPWAPWAFSSRLCSKMKRWLQLGYQILGWEQQQPRLRDCWVVTQEIGLFALAASRVGAQSPKISDFEILWVLVSHIFFLWVLFPLSSTTMVNIFLWVLRAVNFRLSSAATSLPILQLLGQHLATSEHVRRYGFHPKQLTNSPKIGLLKHLETSRNILKQLGRVGDIKVVLEPVAAIAAAGTGASPATGPWCGRWRWKWMEFLGFGPLDPRKILGKSSEKPWSFAFWIGRMPRSWKSWTCLGVLTERIEDGGRWRCRCTNWGRNFAFAHVLWMEIRTSWERLECSDFLCEGPPKPGEWGSRGCNLQLVSPQSGLSSYPICKWIVTHYNPSYQPLTKCGDPPSNLTSTLNRVACVGGRPGSGVASITESIPQGAWATAWLSTLTWWAQCYLQWINGAILVKQHQTTSWLNRGWRIGKTNYWIPNCSGWRNQGSFTFIFWSLKPLMRCQVYGSMPQDAGKAEHCTYISDHFRRYWIPESAPPCKLLALW